MATRPDPNTPATFYLAVEQLCDDVSGLLSQLAALQQVLGSAQGAIGAEVQSRQQSVAAEAQARANADAQETQARAQGISSEAAARAAAIQQEQQDRTTAISQATQGISDRITTLGDSLRDALNAETRARTSADSAEQQARVDAIQAQAQALADAVATLEAKIATKAESTDLSKQLADAVASIKAVTDAISAAITAQRLDFVAYPGRPGNAPVRYTFVAAAATLAGPRAALPLIPSTMVAGTENGPVVRVDGAGVVAGRAACPLESGRLYRARYVIQRRANPADPSGDAVLCGLVYLDQSLRVLGDVVPVRAYPALITAFGRQECEALIARTPGLGEAFVAPSRARFMVPVVATFGPDALTDVEVLNLEDVTGSFVLAPPPDGLEARLEALVAGLTERIQVLESKSGNPEKLTFGSRGAAASSTIPESVQVIELLGRRYAGDGGAGLYVRTSDDLPAGADTFTSHGSVFVRVAMASDVAAGVLASAKAGLPTELPDGSGVPWLNNGSLGYTP